MEIVNLQIIGKLNELQRNVIAVLCSGMDEEELERGRERKKLHFNLIKINP